MQSAWSPGFSRLIAPLSQAIILSALALFVPLARCAETNQTVQAKEPAKIKLGPIEVDSVARTVSFPATVNMTEGAVEYWICSAVGKLHESVLKTDADPAQIHASALLLGAKGAQTNLTVQQFNTNAIPGDAITLAITWTDGATNKTVPANATILNTASNAIMTAGSWVYTGSQMSQGSFVAQRDGLVAAIMSDPLALINNPRPGRENDDIWKANPAALPAVGTAVTVIMKFERSK